MESGPASGDGPTEPTVTSFSGGTTVPTTETTPTITPAATLTGALTIPPDWNPIQPECNLDRYYVWEWNSSSRRVVLGSPAQTTECLPPGWGPDATFEATRCPSDYTPVATACHWAPDAVICCPTMFAFSCYNTESTPFSGHSYYRCASQFIGTVVVDATWTDLMSSTETPGRATMSNPGNLFAVALVYTTPTSSPSDSNTGPSSGPDSGQSSGGISTNASIGVGVGVGIGVLLLAAAVFFMFRRRRRRKQLGPGAAVAAGPGSEAPKDARAELAYHPVYPGSTPSPAPYSPYPVVPGRHEMEGDRNSRSELP